MKKFSIITCTKNSSLTILDTINSVKDQNYENFEHIFVDGGSNDETVNLCNESLNSKVYIEPNLNLYEALNYGIKKSNGEIIFILHSDDQIIDNNLLKNICNLFEHHQISYTYSHIIMKKNKKIYRRWNTNIIGKNEIDNFKFPAHTSFFYKKEVFENIGFYDLNFKISSDFDHLSRLFNSGLKGFFYDEAIVSMNYGGISTKSLKNILIQNFENYLIFKNNKINFIKILIIFIKKFINRYKQLKL